jgi:hypothetical protein
MLIPEELFAIPRVYRHRSVPMSWGCCCTLNLKVDKLEQAIHNSLEDDNEYDEEVMDLNNTDTFHQAGRLGREKEAFWMK